MSESRADFNERGRGRPPIGRPVPIRFPAAQRAQIESAALPGETLADTVRRLISEALAAHGAVPCQACGAPLDPGGRCLANSAHLTAAGGGAAG
jgi:hypothetical protein